MTFHPTQEVEADTTEVVTGPVPNMAPSHEEQAERAAAGLAKRCIQSCRLQDIFTSTKFFRPQPLTQLVRSLVLGERTRLPACQNSRMRSLDSRLSGLSRWLTAGGIRNVPPSDC